MAYSNRTEDTTGTTGTGSITLSGTAPAGRIGIAAAFATGASVDYLIESADGSAWEIGTGVLQAGGILTRPAPQASSAAGALVNFGAGTKTVKHIVSAAAMNDLLTNRVTSVAGRAGAVTLTAADITDSTAAGRAVLTAADAAAQRTAIGAAAASALASKQDTLVSGTSIKTINGESLLGGTDIPVVTQAGVGVAVQLTRSVLSAPWRIAAWGDSRANASHTPAQVQLVGNGLAGSLARTPHWMAGIMGDAEIVSDYAAAGDTAANWDSASRSKLVTKLMQDKPDAIFLQFGINDISAGTSAATLLTYLKAMCLQLISNGTRVIFEAINPIVAYDDAFVVGLSPFFGSTPATAEAKRVIVTTVNDAMQTFIAALSATKMIVYADTYAALLKPATVWGDSSNYLNDGMGVHFNHKGGATAGAICAAAARTILAKKPGPFYSLGQLQTPNLVPTTAPTIFWAVENGTFTVNSAAALAYGTDGTPYIETTVTAATLGGSPAVARGRLEIHAVNVSGATPKFPIVLGDRLQGAARVVIDSGTNGAACTALQMPQVVLKATNAPARFTQIGSLSDSDLRTLTLPVDARLATPPFDVANASAAISTPASGAGLVLQVYVSLVATGVPCRLRVYAPSIRVISRAQPSSVAVGASPYTYTHPEVGGPDEADLLIAGGTVTTIAVRRGVEGAAITTGLTAGYIRVARGDAVVITHTAAPTATLVPR